MAKEAYDKVPLLLSDGTEVVLKPLNIGRLRRFMKAWGQIKEVDPEDETAGFDIFVNCAGIALEPELKDQFKETKGEGDRWLSEEYQEYLEDVLDMESIYKILEVCGDLKLRQLADDPNLLRAVQEAQAGKN